MTYETYRRDWRTCEKHEATAFYCPWCDTLIEGNFAWDAKKALGLHTADRGVFPSCPARRVLASGRVIIQGVTNKRWGIYPLRRRERGCGTLLQWGAEGYGIGWYVFCPDCAPGMMTLGVIATKGTLRMATDCGQAGCGVRPPETVAA